MNLQKGAHGQIDFTWLTSNKLYIREVETILEFHCQTKPRHKAGSNGFKSPGRRRCAPCVLHAKVTYLMSTMSTQEMVYKRPVYLLMSMMVDQDSKNGYNFSI